MINLHAPFLEEDGAGSGAQQETSSNTAEDGKKSFEEILKENGSYQSELDRRINKAVETATAKERERQKIIQDKMQDEVLRVSRMTEDEKDAYFKKKAEDEARVKEDNLTRRELMLDAREVLADKGLPNSFLDLLNYKDKDACMKSIDALGNAFDLAVQAGVAEKLKGSAPPKDARSEGEPAKSPSDEILAQMRKIAGVKTK